MSRKRRTVAVIGLGTFGSTVAAEMARFGNDVIGVDIDAKRVNAQADNLAQALILDARDDAALREAGLEECTIGLVAIGSDIEASILATMNLKTLGVGDIWAKAASKNHHRILLKLGVSRVIHPEAEVGQRVAQMMNNPMVRDFASLGNGFHIVSFRVPDSLDGASLDDLDHTRFDLRCLGVMRGTEFRGRDGEPCPLKEKDLLILLGERGKLRDFGDSLH
ncbi:TrkA family potassium uptake protein [Alphaproteobacteria bacterium GH1-50]|uniref:TrkA family potassium uptake protein n=1 Tax=Kangsaoukella pontilimi TaxID=2691042 RepID=A0A7C9IQH7_9RHOB|nr:TrkA family potassium uptake protein [Kangsaoukella pontilimi]MXQ09170.1 TrkA family potassium uptake protein [Kangsaoukella pontilimi]